MTSYQTRMSNDSLTIHFSKSPLHNKEITSLAAGVIKRELSIIDYFENIAIEFALTRIKKIPT